MGSLLFNSSHTDVNNRANMEHSRSASALDLDDSVLNDFDDQPPVVCASPLDHLKIRSGLVLEVEPFLNSLRRVYY